MHADFYGAGLLESQRSPDLHVTTAVTSWTLESSPYNTYIVSGILFVSTCTYILALLAVKEGISQSSPYGCCIPYIMY